MSLLNEIIDWVENKPIFWQVAIDRLIKNNELSDTDIWEIKEICKADFGLSTFKFEQVNFDDLREFASNSSGDDNITLSKIFNTSNIKALSHTNELRFAPTGLTVVYGDNGSGKSSYVSILKHTCKTRGQKPKLNGNLYEPDTFGDDNKADVEYTLDSVNFSSVNLINGEVNDSKLKSVNVFDTFSANHYIEGEDEIAFIPQGLSVVEKFAIYLKRIENEITLEISDPKLAKFEYSILEVSDDSSAKKFLDKLNHDATLDELRNESNWNNTKELKAISLVSEIDKLKASDPKKSLKANEEKINRFEILKNKFQILENNLSGQFLTDIKLIINNKISSADALKKSSEIAFSKLPIEGVGNNSWKILWESARKFYNEGKKADVFPETNEESKCPLCFQQLEEDAKKRFFDFENFVKNDIQKSYDEAREKYDLTNEILNNITFTFDELKPTIIELEELQKGFTVSQEDYLKVLSEQKSYLLELFNSKVEIDSIVSIDVTNTPKTSIIEIIKNLKETNEKLKVQSIEDELKPLIKELNQLSGEKKIFEYKPKLAREIYRQKKIKLLNQCLAKCNTRPVTVLSNDLASRYVTQGLKQNFKAELIKLGFKNIKIETETKGQKGKQYHYLRLNEENASGISLKDILSEGEHRCISLATFLSELSISEHKSAVIFDDPVSSLDHKWRNKISERIVEESKERQVIVFTHDITFLMMIQEYCCQLSCSLDIKSLTRKRKETGLIASNPPWDALSVKLRIGILKKEHQDLEKIERNETDEIYKERAKFLYGKLRETWERFIEELFLNGVIQRFGRAVQTQRLAKIIDLTEDDYKIVERNMSKCSTYFTGHDTAGALIEEMPDSDEFLTDLNILEKYIAEMRKRR